MKKIERINFEIILAGESLLQKWGTNKTAKMIQKLRKSLMTDERPLSTLPGGTGTYDHQTISKAVRGSKNRINCLRLCHLAFISGFPVICELGTNLGISSGYLGIGAASANKDIRVRTGDISGARINIARELHTEAGLKNIDYFVGDLVESIDNFLVPSIGLCFIDALHTYDATIQYFKQLRPCMKPGGVMVFDDINWSEGMQRAWDDITKSETFCSKAEIDGVGYLQVI
jgi:predicted O-methyltransferase YrrM